jgi:hypothetical protein
MLMNFFQVFKKYILVYDQTQGSSAVFALLYTNISNVYGGGVGRWGCHFRVCSFVFAQFLPWLWMGMYHVTTTSHHSFQVHETLLVFWAETCG